MNDGNASLARTNFFEQPAPTFFRSNDTPVTEGAITRIPTIVGGGYDSVKHHLFSENDAVLNVTMDDHFLYPGIVLRVMVEIDDEYYIVSMGMGNGMLPTLNNFFAETYVWGMNTEAIAAETLWEENGGVSDSNIAVRYAAASASLISTGVAIAWEAAATLIYSARNFRSPLVLDIDGSGTIELTSVDGEGAVYFDLTGSGFATATGWTTGGDGFLALDLNQDGFINDGTELFGDQSGQENGFLSLTLYDSNNDTKITQEDQIWQDLKVWIDGNQNGYSEASELFSLDDLLIEEINLSYVEVNYQVEGNEIRQSSSFVMNGESYQVADVYFSTDAFNSVYVGDVDLVLEALLLPQLRGYGTLADFHIAMSMDSDLEDSDSLISLMTAFSLLEREDIFAADTFAMDAIKEILFRWSGADGLDPNSRGSYIDARIVAFTEAVTATPFMQAGYRTDPLWNAAEALQEGFDIIQTHVYAMLVAQTDAGRIFTGDFYYNIATDSLSGITGLNFDVLDELETSASALSNTSEREVFWQNVVRLVDNAVGISNLDSASLSGLETAIFNSDATLELADILELLGEESHVNTIAGTSGADTLTGTSGHDDIRGNGDADILSGGEGNDELYGGSGNDILTGGLHNDYLNGDSGADTYVYNAGDGIDIIDDDAPSSYADKILLGSGLDIGDLTFTRTGRYDLEISLDNGASVGKLIIANHFNVYGTIETIEFSDTTTLDLTSLDYTQYGSAEDDALYGVQYGGSGNDTIYGGDGNDTIRGYNGTNVLYGDAGNDTIYGGSGADTLYGGSGNDVLEGGDGNNVYDTGAGNDSVKSGNGDDTYYYTGGHDVYTEG